MSTENWLDFLAISMDPRRADGMRFTINLVTPDNGEKFLVEMSNATLTNIKGEQAKNPDLTITLNRADLNTVMIGTSTFDDLLKAGKAKFDGDRQGVRSVARAPGRFRAEFRDPPGHGREDALEGAEAIRNARPGAAGRRWRLTTRPKARAAANFCVMKSACGLCALELAR